MDSINQMQSAMPAWSIGIVTEKLEPDLEGSFDELGVLCPELVVADLQTKQHIVLGYQCPKAI